MYTLVEFKNALNLSMPRYFEAFSYFFYIFISI
jgi:hypothetical protein